MGAGPPGDFVLGLINIAQETRACFLADKGVMRSKCRGTTEKTPAAMTSPASTEESIGRIVSTEFVAALRPPLIQFPQAPRLPATGFNQRHAQGGAAPESLARDSTNPV